MHYYRLLQDHRNRAEPELTQLNLRSAQLPWLMVGGSASSLLPILVSWQTLTKSSGCRETQTRLVGVFVSLAAGATLAGRPANGETTAQASFRARLRLSGA